MLIHVADLSDKSNFTINLTRVPCLHEIVLVNDGAYVVRNVMHLSNVAPNGIVASISVIKSTIIMEIPK